MDKKFLLRLPVKTYQLLSLRAEKMKRSINSQIIFELERKQKSE